MFKKLLALIIIFSSLTINSVQAGSDPLVGEVMIFAGNFCPRGWAAADGQLLPVSQNDALFSLYGTTYGGDGRTTFGLPDLRGRITLGEGNGPGLSNRRLGEKSGQEKVGLTINQIPSHSHGFSVLTGRGVSDDPSGKLISESGLYRMSGSNLNLNTATISSTGGGQPHNNMPAYQVLTHCIALFGVYPSRH